MLPLLAGAAITSPPGQGGPGVRHDLERRRHQAVETVVVRGGHRRGGRPDDQDEGRLGRRSVQLDLQPVRRCWLLPSPSPGLGEAGEAISSSRFAVISTTTRVRKKWRIGVIASAVGPSTPVLTSFASVPGLRRRTSL
jgi:hypothetical protein